MTDTMRSAFRFVGKPAIPSLFEIYLQKPGTTIIAAGLFPILTRPADPDFVINNPQVFPDTIRAFSRIFSHAGGGWRWIRPPEDGPSLQHMHHSMGKLPQVLRENGNFRVLDITGADPSLYKALSFTEIPDVWWADEGFKHFMASAARKQGDGALPAINIAFSPAPSGGYDVRFFACEYQTDHRGRWAGCGFMIEVPYDERLAQNCLRLIEDDNGLRQNGIVQYDTVDAYEATVTSGSRFGKLQVRCG